MLKNIQKTLIQNKNQGTKYNKILNYVNANQNLIKRENNRIETLHNTKPGNKIDLRFSNEEDERPKIFDVFDINDLHKRNIKCFFNVYQEKYKNDINVTGFGDFIRGNYFLLDFCDKFNFGLQIFINHPVNMFLKCNFNSNISSSTIFPNIPFFMNNNWDSHYIDKQNYLHSVPGKLITSAFISYVKDEVPVIKGAAFVYTIAYPIGSIPQKHKKIMQLILEPNDEMKSYVNQNLNNLELTKKEYIVIHIRSGDSYLITEKKELATAYLKNLLAEISLLVQNQSNSKNTGLTDSVKFVLITDNNDIKQFIKQIFPNFAAFFNEITHFGEGTVLQREKVKNTLLEFYIMGLAKKIYSFSSYEHGSGFSQWCAETYNIPYFCKLINANTNTNI